MQTLKFDDGVINLDVNGSGRILSFNPTDARVYDGFFQLANEMPEKLNKLSAEEEKLNAKGLDETERAKEELKLYAEIDKTLREGFDDTFGEGASDALFGTQYACSLASNGEFIFNNAIMALVPYFEKETKKRKEKVKAVARQYKE